MLKDEVLALLKESAGEVSGQAMSERLGGVPGGGLEGHGGTAGGGVHDLLRAQPGVPAGGLAGPPLPRGAGRGAEGADPGRGDRLPGQRGLHQRQSAPAAPWPGQGRAVGPGRSQTGGKGTPGRSFESPAGRGSTSRCSCGPKCSLRELM